MRKHRRAIPRGFVNLHNNNSYVMKNIFVKIIIVFIAIFSIISFVGCKENPNPNPNPDEGSQPTLGGNVDD